MASSAETLKSFLISIGFNIDQAGMNRFASSIAIQTEAVRVFADAITDTASKVVDFVRDVAEGLSDTYFAARMLHTTVGTLQALGYAADQTGLDFNKLKGNINSFYNEAQTRPGLLQLFGVSAEDVKKNSALSYLEAVQNVISRYGRTVQAYNLIQQRLGLNPNEVDLLLNPEFLEKYNKELVRSGSNADDAGKAAARLHQRFGDVKQQLQDLAERVIVRLADAWDHLNPKTKEQVESLGDLITDAEKLVKWWNSLSNTDKTLIETIGGITLAFIGATAAIKATSSAIKAFETVSAAAKGIGMVLGIGGGKAVAGAAEKTGIRSVLGLTGEAAAGSAAGEAIAGEAAAGPPGWILAVATALGIGGYAAWKDYKSWKETGKSTIPWDKIARGMQAVKDGAVSVGTAAVNGTSKGVASLFASLEQKYDLPAGLIDSDYAAESGRGKYLHSPAGAEGPFQFMPRTAAEYGLKDPDNLEDSADAFARKIRHLIDYYHGNMVKAVAAYNWGEGNLDRKGLVNAPLETQIYIRKVLGADYNPYTAELIRPGGADKSPSNTGDVHITQHVTTTVTGSSNPQDTAQAVTKSLQTSNGLLVRALQPRVS